MAAPPPPMPGTMPPAPTGYYGYPTGPVIPTMRKPRAAPPSEPQQTLYIRNLNEKKNPKAIIRHLQQVFTQYGKILSISCSRHMHLRGQAFLVFSDITSAKKAMKEANGFPLFGKPMDIQYSREKSLVVAQKDGTLDTLQQTIKARRETKIVEKKETKKEARHVVSEFTLPNAILFLQNLPGGTTKEYLEALFSQFPGFMEVRTVPGKPDLAFVEYENETLSAVAKQSLHGFRIGEDEIRVSYAKK